MTEQERALGAPAARTAQYSAAQYACSYILNRIQEDPDLRYYAGPMTETFHLLCLAQAEYTGQPLAAVEEERAKDLQPEYRRREADVLVLKRRIAELEEGHG